MLEYAYFLKQTTQTKDLLKRRRDVLAAVGGIFELVDKRDRFAYFPQEVRLCFYSFYNYFSN